DRFVLRDFTAQLTLGGGEVLDTSPSRHRRGDAEALESLRRREQGGPEEALLEVLRRASGGTRTVGALAQEMQTPAPQVESWVSQLAAAGEVVVLGKSVALASLASALEDRLLGVLAKLEQGAPWKVGWRKEEILRLLASETPKLAEEVLAELGRSGQIQDKNGLLSNLSHQPTLAPSQQKALERLEGVLRSGAFAPPDFDAALAGAQVDARSALIIEGYLLESGRGVKVAPNLVFLEETLARARELLAEAIRQGGPLGASEAREVLGTTRKFLIPMLEYFDRMHFTQRDGDKRILYGQKVKIS
ncbi:hypothetical protein DYH09_29240, partial [bacterium CPR1]|nr:hypothetical protein [bacterium CPR1]